MSAADLCIYDEFPRHVGRTAALKSIEKATKRLVKGEAGNPAMTEREAQVKLYRATQAYARSPAGSNPDRMFIPHPSTFYNQGRYLDDPSEWEIVNGKNSGLGNTKADEAQRALLAAHALFA